MTISFESDNDVIVYTLERIISSARKTQQIFVAQCVWWLASVIGLESGLTIHIDNLRKRSELVPQELFAERETVPVAKKSTGDTSTNIHPDRVSQVTTSRAVSATPRDLAEDKSLDQVLDKAEQYIEQSELAKGSYKKNRANPLPQTKAQLKKARKAKFLQTQRNKAEVERQEILRQIRDQVIEKLTKDGVD
jgi:hypothetical protein